jgi:hypothetical protein
MDGIDRQLALGHASGLTASKLLCALSAIAGAYPSSADLAGLLGQCRSRLGTLGLSAAACAALRAPDAAGIAAAGAPLSEFPSASPQRRHLGRERAEDIQRKLRIRSSEQQLGGAASAGEAAAPTVIRLDNDYKILLDALGFEPASPDVLVERTGLPSQSVASMLLFLELEDIVGLQSGGRYVRL